jgi:hypothetical protein
MIKVIVNIINELKRITPQLHRVSDSNDDATYTDSEVRRVTFCVGYYCMIGHDMNEGT